MPSVGQKKLLCWKKRICMNSYRNKTLLRCISRVLNVFSEEFVPFSKIVFPALKKHNLKFPFSLMTPLFKTQLVFVTKFDNKTAKFIWQ